jgi:hypothetical protein
MKLLAAETLSRLVKFSGDCGHDAANIQALGRLLKHQTSGLYHNLRVILG